MTIRKSKEQPFSDLHLFLMPLYNCGTMNKSEQARAVMLEHHLNCAQSVVSTYCEEFGLDRNLGLKVAMGFGGGMARTGKTCGAVTGAYMIMGLSQRINENNARESIERTYKLMLDFNREFMALHGSLNCKDLIKLDLAIPEQRAKAQDRHLFATVCPDLVRDAAKIMESLLATC
jgi:C_GCAxxG_C_C family probable redox protein